MILVYSNTDNGPITNPVPSKNVYLKLIRYQNRLTTILNQI